MTKRRLEDESSDNKKNDSSSLSLSLLPNSVEQEENKVSSVIHSSKIAKKNDEIPKISETFADPTYDTTFKKLFGIDENKDILINLLNSLLDLTGDKEIKEVQINSNETPASSFSSQKGVSGITSSVDILCANKGRHKIAIEMQGQRANYFLAREQDYMAKLIAGQVKEGEGKLYHKKILETYIVIIGKNNMFVGNTALKDQSLFEINVMPMIKQTGELYPDNKMFWKFFELPKFQQSNNYKLISKDSSLKEQWLEFLIDCSVQRTVPDRKDIIKKGYEIMEVAKWSPDTQSLYWREKEKEKADLKTL